MSIRQHEERWRGDGYASKLSTKKIVVLGAGAIGSHAVDGFTRVGASNIRVIDYDRVEDGNNLVGQVFRRPDVGALKVDALKAHVFAATGIEIETISKKLDASNARKFFKDAAIIIDAADNHDARRIIHEYSHDGATIHAGLEGEHGYGEVVWDHNYKVPLDAKTGDACELPLARSLIMLTATVLVEEVLDWCLAERPRYADWSITLRDLKISRSN